MKSNNIKALVVVAIITAMAIFIYVFYYNITPQYNWKENYEAKSTEPYGTNVFCNLLKSSVAKNNFYEIDTSILQLKKYFDSGKMVKNYVFLGEEHSFNEESAELLKRFVEKGNKAFFISYDIPNSLNEVFGLGKLRMRYWTESLPPEEEDSTSETEKDSVLIVHHNLDSAMKASSVKDALTAIDTTFSLKKKYFAKEFRDTIYDSFPVVNGDTIAHFKVHKEYFRANILSSEKKYEAQINFTNNNLKDSKNWSYDYFYDNNYFLYNWSYVDTAFCCDSIPINILGRYDEFETYKKSPPNFVHYKIGKGDLYLHTMPFVFTNYHLTEERKFDYVNKFCSYFSNGEIIWDEASKHYLHDSDDENKENDGTPLQYIFSQSSLKWSWYVGLLGVLLYLVFHIKRQIPVIPIYLEKQNTSLQYIKNISYLYFSQKAFYNIGVKKWKLFSQFILQRYGEKTMEMNDEFKTRLAKKSGIELSAIAALVDYGQRTEHLTFSSQELILLHQHLQYFYKNCK